MLFLLDYFVFQGILVAIQIVNNYFSPLSSSVSLFILVATTGSYWVIRRLLIRCRCVYVFVIIGTSLLNRWNGWEVYQPQSVCWRWTPSWGNSAKTSRVVWNFFYVRLQSKTTIFYKWEWKATYHWRKFKKEKDNGKNINIFYLFVNLILLGKLINAATS